MLLKKIAVATALSLLLASPCAASPWTETLTGLLDSLLRMPRTLAGLSEEKDKEEAPLSPVLPEPGSPGARTRTDGLNPDDPSTEKGGKIDVDG